MAPRRFVWSSAALSDVGLVRRVNEDAFLDACDTGLWAVADGMGGHDFGDVASKMIIDALACQPGCRTLTMFSRAVRKRLQKVNDALRNGAARQNVAMMGTTVVVLLAAQGGCAILWAGDSRAYCMRGGLLRQITCDHRHAVRSDQVGDGTTAGSPGPPCRIGSTGAASDRSAAGSNVITRAVGAAPTLVLDEVGLSIEDGDIFLLCSDGLTGMVSDAEIAQALTHGSCRQAAQGLISLALQRGGTDNVTAVVACATDPYSNDRTVFNPAA